VHKVKLHAKVNFKVLVISQSRRDRLGYTISENKALLNRWDNPLKGLNIPIVFPSGKKNTISKKRPAERSSTRIAASKMRLSKLVTLGIPSEVTPLSSQATGPQATGPQATKEDGILEAASSIAGPQATPSSAGPHATPAALMESFRHSFMEVIGKDPLGDPKVTSNNFLDFEVGELRSMLDDKNRELIESRE
jgi:hypothetical protein